jgi:hypothetical protein
MRWKLIFFGAVFSSALSLTGCSDSGTNSGNTNATAQPTGAYKTDVQMEDPVNLEGKDTEQNTGLTKIILFNGIGTSLTDWKSTESIIQSMGLTYRLMNSSQLNAISLSDLKNYSLIIIPGGNSNVINNYLTKATKIKVRQSVRDYGVSYLGLCAGAFAAVGPDTYSNTTAYYGFAVAKGNYIPHWYPNGNTSLLYAIPRISFPNGTGRYMIWWDGPSTPEWYRGVVARYPGGKPAISQTWTSQGFVVLSGPHPEAPSSWWYDTGKDPDGLDHDWARKLIQAALNRQPLPTY